MLDMGRAGRRILARMRVALLPFALRSALLMFATL
jgi:hypothetical protein